MGEGRLCHVLLLYWHMIPSIRLCGHCQMEELAREKQIEYRACQAMKAKREDLNWADIVLLGRLDNWYGFQLVKILKSAGKHLIYIIDDDLLSVPAEIDCSAYYKHNEVRDHILGMIEMSDAILSPSPILLGKYAIDGRNAVQIEEPAIKPIEFRMYNPDSPIKIGFAGSVDRASELESILKEALIRIKREYREKVQFEFFGAIPSYANELQANTIPYCDSYEEYREVLNRLEWDIGLAPMPDTPFHACKHYNKFVEYAAAGVVGIYSRVEPYIRLERQFGLGVFCENTPQAWYESIKWLIQHHQERESFRKEALQCAKEELSVSASARTILQYLKQVENTGTQIRWFCISGMHCRYWSKHLHLLYRQYGFRAVLQLIQMVMRKWKRIGFWKRDGQ